MTENQSARCSRDIHLAELSCQEDAHQGADNEPQRKKEQKNAERVQRDLLFQRKIRRLLLQALLLQVHLTGRQEVMTSIKDSTRTCLLLRGVGGQGLLTCSR